MLHVQGYSRCHWMTPLGDYLVCIAPEATRTTANKTMMKNTPTFLAIPMAMAMRLYVTARITQWKRSRASLEATRCCHWVSIHSNNIKGTYLRWFFWCFSLSTPVLSSLLARRTLKLDVLKWGKEQRFKSRIKIWAYFNLKKKMNHGEEECALHMILCKVVCAAISFWGGGFSIICESFSLVPEFTYKECIRIRSGHIQDL